MDAISANDSSPQRIYTKSSSSPVSSNKSKQVRDLDSGVSLVDLTELGKRANQSENDIRPDVVARAKDLLADPNWINDSSIESLAERLISHEGF